MPRAEDPGPFHFSQDTGPKAAAALALFVVKVKGAAPSVPCRHED